MILQKPVIYKEELFSFLFEDSKHFRKFSVCLLKNHGKNTFFFLAKVNLAFQPDNPHMLQLQQFYKIYCEGNCNCIVMYYSHNLLFL